MGTRLYEYKVWYTCLYVCMYVCLSGCVNCNMSVFSFYCREDNICKHFSGDVAHVAKKCWVQIHPNITGATEVYHCSVLERGTTAIDVYSQDKSRALHWPRPQALPLKNQLAGESLVSFLI